MAYVYFARHGQTVWNVENKICGATDIELTELGHQQAIELGEKIVEKGITFDEILYSPLVRASETARHVSEITGVPMREEPRLKEQNFGKYESPHGMERNSRLPRRTSLITMRAANLCYRWHSGFIIC